jgi:nitrite reductase/ring-hydroxylating ferredoxin subunit
MAFAKTLPREELWLGEMRGCDVAGRRVLVLRLAIGIYAYEDRCAHLRVPLSEGTLRDGVLRCGAHGFEYDAVTGLGINPKNTRLVALPVRLEGGYIWVDPEPAPEARAAQGPAAALPPLPRERHVGPVLEASESGRAVVAAIRELNEHVQIVDRGAYLRVLVPCRCVVTRRAIELALGRTFHLPTDLETLMPAFKGFLHMDDERVEWRCERA